MHSVQIKRVDALKAGDLIIGMACYQGSEVYELSSVLHVVGVHEVKGYGKFEVGFYPNGKGRLEWLRRDTGTAIMIK